MNLLLTYTRKPEGIWKVFLHQQDHFSAKLVCRREKYHILVSHMKQTFMFLFQDLKCSEDVMLLEFRVYVVAKSKIY